MLNSLSFCLSVKLLNSPSYLNETLAGYSNLGCRFFFFHHVKYVLPFPSGWKSFYRNISCYPYGNPLVCYFFFPLAAFNISSLCLNFLNLINVCCGVFHLGFILFLTLWVSWTWLTISFPILGKFSTISYLSIFSQPFFLSSSSGTPMIPMLGCLTLSQRSLRLSSFLYILFSFFPSASFISTILSSTSLILSSASVILLLVPSRVFLISFFALFTID